VVERKMRWLRKYRVSNLPVYRRKGLSPKVMYRIYCVEVKKTLLSTPFLFKTIAKDGVEVLDHVQEFCGRDVGDVYYVKPVSASPFAYPKELFKLMKEEV
jgi:hypothetical protein